MSDFTTQENHPSADPDRGDLEIEEVWRAASAAGFDTDVDLVDEDRLRCGGCGSTDSVERFVLDEARPALDTPSGRNDLAVFQVRCPACARAGRAIAPAVLADRFAGPGDERPAEGHEVEHRHARPDKSPEHPLGDDQKFFDEGSPGNLRDLLALTDDEGDDIRMYSGEPVETEDGWVIPHQQNVGPGNQAGTGEFPDPDTPSATEPGVDRPPTQPGHSSR